jgi:thiol-disulfide isomerase/thioredoxin
MKFRCRIIFILFFWCSASKANTIISGQIFNCNKTITADYFLPIGQFYNPFYDNRDIKIGSNHTFRIDLKLDSSGFLILNFPGKTYFLFVQPGDKINLELYYSQTPDKKWLVSNTLYSGNNSEGHRIFNSYGPFLHSMDVIRKLVFGEKYISITQLFGQTTNLTDSLLQPFSLLLKSKKIDEIYCAHISTELKISVSILVITIFNYYVRETPEEVILEKDEKVKGPFFMNADFYNENNNTELKQLFYKTISPYDPTILSTSFGVLYLELYYSDILAKNVPYSGNISYDTTFNFLDSDSRYLGYLKGETLEMSWANFLHFEAINDTSDERLLRSFAMFSHKFPHSGFIEGLSERLGIVVSESNHDSVRTDYLNIIRSGKYKSLNELISGNFKNEYVFIDLWATWCVPCIEQFIFKNKLEDFLNKEDIVILYISIDSKSNEKKWEGLIHSKKLNGSHYLVDDDFLANIKSVVYKNGPITIPRYLMVNNKGLLVSTNLPRPSDFNLLQAEIKKLKSVQNSPVAQ